MKKASVLFFLSLLVTAFEKQGEVSSFKMAIFFVTWNYRYSGIINDDFRKAFKVVDLNQA